VSVVLAVAAYLLCGVLCVLVAGRIDATMIREPINVLAVLVFVPFVLVVVAAQVALTGLRSLAALNNRMHKGGNRND